jgi:hypothetical protein
MSKKRGTKPAPKAVPRSRNTVSNYQRTLAERAKHVPFLDRVAHWLGRRSRFTRTVLCALIALIFTISFTILIYGTFFSIDPRRLNFGPITAVNLPFFTFIVLAIMGYAFYWAGWRVMIGFDFEDHPLQPGRPAAIWLLLGGAMFILMTVASIIVAIQAAQ